MEEWLGLGRPAVRRAAPWLVATIVLGGAFLAGQWIAWKQLAHAGLLLLLESQQPLLLSRHRTHGVHLLLGVGALLFALFAMFRFKRVEMRQIAVDCTAWYWHAMGLFWIFLFALLVFFQ